MKPGLTAFTLMPLAANSIASVLLNAITAPFEAEYAVLPAPSVPGGRGDVDDYPAFAASQCRKRVFHRQVRAAHVHVEHQVPIVGGEFFHQTDPQHASYVD